MGVVLVTKCVTSIQPKKTKLRLYYPLILQQKAPYALYITNKMEHGPCHQYGRGLSNEMYPGLQLKKT